VITSLFNKIFGCAHNRTTFPLTTSRGSRLAVGEGKATYVVCLTCGKEFDYDWNQMRILSAVRIPSYTVTQAEQIVAS
jgi:hypothetical protein